MNPPEQQLEVFSPTRMGKDSVKNSRWADDNRDAGSLKPPDRKNLGLVDPADNAAVSKGSKNDDESWHCKICDYQNGDCHNKTCALCGTPSNPRFTGNSAHRSDQSVQSFASFRSFGTNNGGASFVSAETSSLGSFFSKSQPDRKTAPRKNSDVESIGSLSTFKASNRAEEHFWRTRPKPDTITENDVIVVSSDQKMPALKTSDDQIAMKDNSEGTSLTMTSRRQATDDGRDSLQDIITSTPNRSPRESLHEKDLHSSDRLVAVNEREEGKSKAFSLESSFTSNFTDERASSVTISIDEDVSTSNNISRNKNETVRRAILCLSLLCLIGAIVAGVIAIIASNKSKGNNIASSNKENEGNNTSSNEIEMPSYSPSHIPSSYSPSYDFSLTGSPTTSSNQIEMPSYSPSYIPSSYSPSYDFSSTGSPTIRPTIRLRPTDLAAAEKPSAGREGSQLASGQTLLTPGFRNPTQISASRSSGYIALSDNQGTVTVYRIITSSENVWVMVGSTLPHDGEGALPIALAASQDGVALTLAVLTSEHLLIYNYDGKEWVEDNRFMSQEGAGSTISISGDGSVLAVTYPTEGYIQVFLFRNEAWERHQMLKEHEFDDVSSMDLSMDGTKIVVGSRKLYLPNIVEACVFELSDNDQWRVHGKPVQFENEIDAPRIAVTISGNGKYWAVSNSTACKVYSFGWTQVGPDIDGGEAASLSRTGNCIAISRPKIGEVQVYRSRRMSRYIIWEEISTLTKTMESGRLRTGDTVAMSDEFIVVSSSGEDHGIIQAFSDVGCNT